MCYSNTSNSKKKNLELHKRDMKNSRRYEKLCNDFEFSLRRKRLIKNATRKTFLRESTLTPIHTFDIEECKKTWEKNRNTKGNSRSN